MKRCVTQTDNNSKRPAYERANLVEDLRNEIQKHQDNLRKHIAELFFYENGGNILDLSKWSSQSNPYLENYIQQIKCASTDAVDGMLEQVPTGHVMPNDECKKKEPEHSSTPFMNRMMAIEKSGLMEQAKYESLIVQQVACLKQKGMWSLKRLPKVKEPPRIKCHWDYLLDEMHWLSTDFMQERKWKKATAKKLATAVAKVFEEKAAAERKRKQDQEKKLKRIAHGIAKDVMKMWMSVEKVHRYKQESKLEERRKKLMDSHLNFIVGQTEQYSSWLVEGLSKTLDPQTSAIMTPSSQDGDVEFKPPLTLDDLDDEETIAQAEAEDNQDQDEISDLQKESELDINDVIKSLPPEMLGRIGSRDESDDNSFIADEEDDEDEEETIEAEEKLEQGDNQKEISGLEADQHVPLDELIAQYMRSKEELSNTSSSSDNNKASCDAGTTTTYGEEEEEEEEDDSCVSEEDADVEMSSVPQSGEEINKELGILCKDAKGITPFSNTALEFKTKTPFLLRGKLREYQHVGLDWLVAMEKKRLNGILADEMGLGKTIQTIALLAHLACFRGIWGPHLIVVPTSVLLNWDLEFKKWCPGFKVMAYYGSQRERKEKRIGWTKPNTFHVCVTSYKLVVQDYRIFRSKKWYYLILDEAHNIKNFKSQRWQLLLNFNSQRRLLLTGTPLQNNLMELWSLMHFLMPTVFGSQRAFREWFSNPLTGMVEGTAEYNSKLIQRLHKILRPFLLRRLKKEVELQLPSKTESVLMCGLSKRQRALYEEFLSRRETRDTLSSGQFISVIGVLMQLRKVCNHPDLFDPRPVTSPFALAPLRFSTPKMVIDALRKGPFDEVDLNSMNLHFADYELNLSAHSAYRTQELKVYRKLIEEVNFKGDIPDKKDIVESPHSTFAPPRSPSPTLPPLPLLRQMPSLNAAPRNTPRTSPHPIASSPRSSADSSGLTPPPLSAPLSAKSTPKSRDPRESTPTQTPLPPPPNSNSQIIRAGFFRDPVSGIALPLVEPGMPPPRRPPLGPPQLTKATGPRPRNTLNPKRSGTAPPPPILTPGSCSSPDMRAIPAMSPARDITDNSPGRTLWESPSRQSDSAPERDEESNARTLSNIFKLASLEELRNSWRESRRKLVASVNEVRCKRVPLFGTDLVRAVTVVNPSSKFAKPDIIQPRTAETRIEELWPVLNRFLVYCPKATSVGPQLHRKMSYDERCLQNKLHDLTTVYHPIKSKLSLGMPETRLIQYDCGKLQRLDSLLCRLKREKHRVLIFTQMTRMLDVLEKFLNYHGHSYSRIDGATKVEKRLELMERFNADSRIFCMMLSTRSGGVGVNLTGADTVIFYDSDWNPTMDAQAQDRCHRIGQTRDVHIYRLICEKTIEENILKKANQKRLLGAVAIEEGNFTSAFFRKDNLSDIFGDSVIKNQTSESPKHRTIPKKDLESVLAQAEDAEDVQAADRANGELREEMNDFDEDVPIEGEIPLRESDRERYREDKDFNKFEEEIKSIEDELTPIEKYALRFIEHENIDEFNEMLKQQDEELNAATPGATLHDLKEAKREEENLNIAEINDVLLTYASWDPQEEPDRVEDIWLPPTPPPQDYDVFHMDPVLQSQYCIEQQMLDSELPDVTIIPNLTFQIIPPAIQIKDEPEDEPPPPPPQAIVIPTQPPQPAVVKQEAPPIPPVEEHAHAFIKRGTDITKINATPFLRKDGTRKLKKRQIKIKHPLDNVVEPDDTCSWLASEDCTLQQSLQGVHEMLNGLREGVDMYNWDIIAGFVNVSSITSKTPKQCRERYSVLLQREEVGMDPRKLTPHRIPGRLSAEDTGVASTFSFVKLFQDIERLGSAKPSFEFKQSSLNAISIGSNPTHNIFNLAEETALSLASKKQDRENKENKNKDRQTRREFQQVHGMHHKVHELHTASHIPTNSIQPAHYHQMQRKMADGSRGGGPAYSVMTSSGIKGHGQQFYLLPAQRPVQGQVNIGPGGKPMMNQGKQILVTAGQNPVKMQSQHVNYMQAGTIRGSQPQSGSGGYNQCGNTEELMQQLKRQHQQQPQAYRNNPHHQGNMIPFNIQKQYLSNGPYIQPNQMRGAAPKGVRTMGPLHLQRGLPIQGTHIIETSDGIHHSNHSNHASHHSNPRMISQVMSSIPSSSPRHQLSPSPQIIQQLKPQPTSRTM